MKLRDSIIAYAPNGQGVAVTQGKDIQLYHKQGWRWEEVAVLRVHEDNVNCVTCAPDGNRLCSGGYDGVRLRGKTGQGH